MDWIHLTELPSAISCHYTLIFQCVEKQGVVKFHCQKRQWNYRRRQVSKLHCTVAVLAVIISWCLCFMWLVVCQDFQARQRDLSFLEEGTEGGGGDQGCQEFKE